MKSPADQPTSAPVRSISDKRLPDRLVLAGCALDLKAHSVVRDSEEVRLTPKATGVLRFLLARPLKAVTREELLDSVWADAFPTDDVLSHAITELRRALGDTARNSEIIETIPKVGYRLLVQPEFPSPVPEELESSEQPGSGRGRRFLGAIVASTLAGAILGAAIMRAYLGNAQPVSDIRPLVTPMVRAVPVTAQTGMERMPAVTDDGRQVVYTAQIDAATGYDLYVKTLGSDTALRVTETPGQSEMTPAWSPDGNQVAFYRYENDQCGLFIKPVMGGFERRLADCAADAITYIDWSPDGDTIAMTGRLDESTTVAGIILLDVSSGKLRPMEYDQSNSDHDVQPKFSPDGSSLAFRRGAFPRSELFLVSREGGNIRQLTDFGSQIFGFDWLPGGRQIWLCTDQAGRAALWQLELATGTSQLLEYGCPHMMSISRTRNVMVYEHLEEDPNIVETVTAGGGQHVNLPLFTSTQSESYPAYSPDGRRVVYVSDRTGQEQLWIGDLVTEESFQLTRLQALKLIRPRWSPDGRYVAYIGRGAGMEGLFKIDVLSGLVERISQEGEHVRSADVSKDGTKVLYTSDFSGDWEVWSWNMKDGERKRITRNGGHRPQDPFGDGHIYYTKLDIFGLWRMPIAGGEEELISDEVAFYNHESWSINETGLYLSLADGEERLAVFRIDLEDGWEREKMIDADADDVLRMHDVSPDGERFLMIRVQDPKQDIMAVSGW